MKRSMLVAVWLLAWVTGSAGVVAAPAGAPPGAPIVYFDIAAPDLGKQSLFYTAIFGWHIAADGRLTVPVVSPLPGTLRLEAAPPMTEKVIYVGVSDVTASLAQVVAHGGTVALPRLVVPGVVILGMFKDPAGNRMGLVEMKAGQPIVPPGHP